MEELFQLIRDFPFLGDATIATLVVVLILTGRLVPRSTVEDIREERDAWRDAYNKEAKTNSEIRRQNSELLEVAKITEHLLTSFKEKSDT